MRAINYQYDDAWAKVQLVRSPYRFNILNVIDEVFTDFFELHGDRYYGDDKAIVGGIAFLEDVPVTVIGNNRLENCGMAMPEGYRKAIRLMKQADRVGRPIITIIDTPGAYPGIEAEERGQASAISANLHEMFQLTVPVISIVIGEGGSGGALALCVANVILMLENAVFSVVSPEGCASILWKDKKLAPKAAQALKMTAQDLIRLKIIDGIIKEDDVYVNIKNELCKILKCFKNKSVYEIQSERYKKYRSIGEDIL